MNMNTPHDSIENPTPSTHRVQPLPPNQLATDQPLAPQAAALPDLPRADAAMEARVCTRSHFTST
jgi:hypothetical protein